MSDALTKVLEIENVCGNIGLIAIGFSYSPDNLINPPKVFLPYRHIQPTIHKQALCNPLTVNLPIELRKIFHHIIVHILMARSE